MEWIGWISLAIILCWSSYPGKVNKLEKRVKKLERSLREENNMSEIIKALVDKCKVISEGGLGFLGGTETICTVLAVDDEWIKISYSDRKGKKYTKILRVDDIDGIELIEE